MLPHEQQSAPYSCRQRFQVQVRPLLRPSPTNTRTYCTPDMLVPSLQRYFKAVAAKFQPFSRPGFLHPRYPISFVHFLGISCCLIMHSIRSAGRHARPSLLRGELRSAPPGHLANLAMNLLAASTTPRYPFPPFSGHNTDPNLHNRRCVFMDVSLAPKNVTSPARHQAIRPRVCCGRPGLCYFPQHLSSTK